MLSFGIPPARTLKHDQILLKSDCSESGVNGISEKICQAFDVVPLTVANVCKRFIKEGITELGCLSLSR